MFESRPEDIATKLGLEFTSDTTQNGVWRRFTIKFPDRAKTSVSGGIAPPTPAEQAKYIAEQRAAAATPDGKRYSAYVSLVTKWRKKVLPWTIDPAPPGESGIIVAAKLTFAGRFAVSKVNKANRAALKKFWSGEAMARRAALSQMTPEAGLYALNEQLAKYGVKKPDAETIALKLQLEKAAAIVALDGEARPVGVTYQ